MERRRLLAVGGVLSVTAFATTVGLGATFGLFGLTQPDSPVGRLGGPAPAAAQVDTAQGSGAAATRPVATTVPIAPVAPVAPAAPAAPAHRAAPADDGADD
jgi:hypothetical protein